MPEAPNAVRGLAEDATSRKRFLRQAGGGGVAASLAVFIAACGGDDSSSPKAKATATPMAASGMTGTEQFGKGDLGIANYALTLEYLETQFYNDAAASGMLKGKVLETAKMFGAEEQEHIDALIALIKKSGGKPADQPKATFPLDSEKAILELAATVENLGANAYLGQAGNIQDREILAAALSIHSVEARHAAVLNLVTKAKPAPGAFAKPATAAEVLKSVKPFLAT
ncbi:MAG TPA: ferritin-like domain-containing protein [Solirubrobacteraceae bacterium]|nr:ferritin-like domain-containing protein [Solirubrobacteraceae bacterium]